LNSLFVIPVQKGLLSHFHSFQIPKEFSIGIFDQKVRTVASCSRKQTAGSIWCSAQGMLDGAVARDHFSLVEDPQRVTHCDVWFCERLFGHQLFDTLHCIFASSQFPVCLSRYDVQKNLVSVAVFSYGIAAKRAIGVYSQGVWQAKVLAPALLEGF